MDYVERMIVGRYYGGNVSEIYEGMVRWFGCRNMRTKKGFLSVMFYWLATREQYSVWFIRYYNEWNKPDSEWSNYFNADFSVLTESKNPDGLKREYSEDDTYRLIFVNVNGNYKFLGLYSVNVVDDYKIIYERIASVYQYPLKCK